MDSSVYKDGYGGCQLEDFALEWLGGRLALGETQVSVCNSLFQRETVQILQRRVSRSPSRGRVLVGESDGHIQLLVLFISGERRTRGSKFRQAVCSSALPLPFSMAILIKSWASPKFQRANCQCFCFSLLCKCFNLCLSLACYIIHHSSTNFSLLLFIEISHLLMSPFPLSLPVVNWLC